MRLLVICAVVVVAAVVYGERCGDTQACINQKVTSCSNSSQLICAPQIHLCVCVVGQANIVRCTDKADCGTCTNGTVPHCFDQMCRCAAL